MPVLLLSHHSRQPILDSLRPAPACYRFRHGRRKLDLLLVSSYIQESLAIGLSSCRLNFYLSFPLALIRGNVLRPFMRPSVFLSLSVAHADIQTRRGHMELRQIRRKGYDVRGIGNKSQVWTRCRGGYPAKLKRE
jgi:hypothetical protein